MTGWGKRYFSSKVELFLWQKKWFRFVSNATRTTQLETWRNWSQHRLAQSVIFFRTTVNMYLSSGTFTPWISGGIKLCWRSGTPFSRWVNLIKTLMVLCCGCQWQLDMLFLPWFSGYINFSRTILRWKTMRSTMGWTWSCTTNNCFIIWSCTSKNCVLIPPHHPHAQLIVCFQRWLVITTVCRPS